LPDTAVRRRLPFVSALACLMLSSTALLPADARAEESLFPPQEICTDQAAGGAVRRQVDPLRLARYLLTVGEISDAALDANNNGDTLLAEKLLAFTEPDYCTRGVGRRCTEEDAAALMRINERLGSFAKRAGGPGYAMQRIRWPNPPDRRGRPYLAKRLEIEGQAFQAGEILDPEGSFVRVLCLAPPPPPPAPVADAEGSSVSAASLRPSWVLSTNGVDGFRLTGDIDDLPADRKTLGSVQPAELSISEDLIEDERRYQVNLVAGYEVGLDRGEYLTSSIIPFVQFERLFDGESDQIDKLGFGAQQVITVTLADLAKNQFAVTPLYLTDSDFDTDIGLLKFRWTPTLAQDAPIPLGFRREIGPAVLQIDFDTLADVGWVFDDGGSDDLDDEEQFFRLGGRLGFRLRGAPGRWFDNIELSISNKYLTNPGSDIDDLYRLDSAISYLFPDDDHYRLSFSYVNGRTDDTLDDVEYWKTQFGVRF
jgi:hypothetical protein